MKKLSANAKRIIALPVLFILIAIFIALNGNDGGPFMYPAILFLFAFFIDLILIIVDGFKYINKTNKAALIITSAAFPFANYHS